MKNPFAAAIFLLGLLGPGMAVASPRAPEFTQAQPADWINSKPLKLAELRGQVVLVEFWTYGCINCLRTLPWLKAMDERYGGEGLVIVAVHSPEFAHERDAARVRAAVERHKIRYAVMLDNDFSYWKALGNRYWPAFYLIDGRGQVVATQYGELHLGQTRADQFEREIKRLLAAR